MHGQRARAQLPSRASTAALTSLPLHLAPATHTQVGRPRPDFVARCWPTTEPSFSAEGFPRCEPGVRHQTADAGLRSFPSGDWPQPLWGACLQWSRRQCRRLPAHACLPPPSACPPLRSARGLERRRPGLCLPLAAGPPALLHRRRRAAGAPGGSAVAAFCGGRCGRGARAEQPVRRPARLGQEGWRLGRRQQAVATHRL